MRTVVLIPARDEAEHIGETVRAAKTVPGVERVLVVDDASEDETAALATAAGADVVRLERNLGKGAALDAGVRAAGHGGWDALLLLDADLGETASQAALLLEPLRQDEADMAVAGFPPSPTRAGFGLVKGLARWGIRTLGSSSFPATAPLSGQRALTARALAAVPRFGSGYGAEVDMTVRLLRAGMRVVEVPTSMTHSETGRDLHGFLHRGRQFTHVAAALARLAVTRGR